MKNIRIGNDININWAIQRNGNPENFAGKTIAIKLIDTFGVPADIGYSISNNVINVTFYGKNQRQLGKYILCLIENGGQVDMNTIDKVDAFCLVRHSCDATGQDECPNLTTETVELTSSIGVGGEVNVNVVQTTGDSMQDVMSQKAVTDNLASKQDKTDDMLDTTSKEVVGAINEVFGSLYDINIDEETETLIIN